METDALCGRHKVSLNRGPKAKSETPRGPFLSEKGFLTPPSSFTPAPGRPVLSPGPLLHLSPLPHLLRPPLSLITWACPCCVVAGEPAPVMVGMASRADSLDFQVEYGN